MTAGTEVIGARRLAATTAAAAAQLAHMQSTHATIAARMANMARARTPRRTGRLAASNRPAASDAAASVTAGGSGIAYAGVIHYGWPAHHIRAQPWLTGTLESSRPAAVAAVDNRIGQIITTIHGAT